MKVLLIQPPHVGRQPQFFPLGLAYIASALMDSGCQVEILDIFASRYTEEEVIKQINQIDYDLVGINAFVTQYKYIKWLTEQIKKCKPSKKIIIGGSFPTSLPFFVLNNTKADICVIGEGEVTIRSIVENLDNLSIVKGIYFKDNAKIIENLPQPLIENLDGIKFPSYDIFPTQTYFEHISVLGVPNPKEPVINIITSRGCPYNCNFCFRSIKGYRLRSVDNIISEIKELKCRYNIKGVVFSDELAIYSKERAYQLCDRIKDLGIKWGCQGRVNVVDLKLLRYMKKCGCRWVGYGIESGSQKILDNMNKQVTVQQNEEAINNTVRAGMYPYVQIMFGYPGEDRETIQDTVDFFKRIHYIPPNPLTSYVDIKLTTPFPKTKLYKEAIEKKLIRDEKEYLMNLEMGCSLGCPVLVNFTAFSNKELLEIKKDMERQIAKNYFNYLLGHPGRLFKEMMIRFIFNIQTLKLYINKFGYRFVLKKIYLKMCTCKFFCPRWYLPWSFLVQPRWLAVNKERIELEIIEFCNLECVNCECSFKHAPSKEFMTNEQIKKFVNESINLNWNWKLIKIRGGEPTLHPELFQIINSLEIYKNFNPNCKFTILTNNFSAQTKEILSRMPAWILIESSEKKVEGGKLIGKVLHDSINIAPNDLLIYKFADFTKGCYRPAICGMQLSRLGYYPCALGVHISRIFGFEVGIKKLSNINEESFRKILNIICRFCGHYKQPSDQAVRNVISPSWKKAFKKYGEKKPRLSVY